MKNQKKTTNKELQQSHCSILMEEVKEKVQMLKEYGMSEREIVSHLYGRHSLTRLAISRNYRIFLGEDRKEIKMEPLVKAVYFLFLKHPEGIKFKDLPDYREELTEIYQQLKQGGLTDRARQSIEDVTNPVLNSINEKCARIRGAFVGEFDDYMARNYYVDGRRGEAKKIALPRELVVWE